MLINLALGFGDASFFVTMGFHPKKRPKRRQRSQKWTDKQNPQCADRHGSPRKRCADVNGMLWDLTPCTHEIQE
ncbi:hypothetical protein ACOTBX_10430 [Achromobacter xylosoxidans]